MSRESELQAVDSSDPAVHKSSLGQGWVCAEKQTSVCPQTFQRNLKKGGCRGAALSLGFWHQSSPSVPC